ncbi:MAG: hypothetical protein ACM3O8_14145 [Methylococcaceae bacterium]
MKRSVIPIVFILLWLGAGAQSRWLFELHEAVVTNVPLPLTIHQKGYPDIQLTGACYHSQPFTLPLYYDGRISRWDNDRSWEIEFTHHKLYLQNPPQEVQEFNVSHGFNMLMVNRGFQRQTFRYRAGAGVVIAHPESEVRGLVFPNSRNNNDLKYYLSGPAIHASINKPIYFGPRLFLNAEASTTLAYASVKVAQGHADVWNIAFHLLLGVGVELKK